MKKYLLLAFLLIASSSLWAQDSLSHHYAMRKRDRMHRQDHLMFQDGTLRQVKQGVHSLVTSPIKLKNGMVVHPGGSYALNKGQRLHLQNEQCLDMRGNIYQSQMMFNQGKRCITKR